MSDMTGVQSTEFRNKIISGQLNLNSGKKWRVKRGKKTLYSFYADEEDGRFYAKNTKLGPIKFTKDITVYYDKTLVSTYYVSDMPDWCRKPYVIPWITLDGNFFSVIT